MRIAALLGCSPYIAGCLSATSYVTLVFYTRTFSNSLESFFLAMLLVCICEYISTHGFHISNESNQSSVTGSPESNTDEAKTEENIRNNLPKSSSEEDKDDFEIPPTVYENKSGSNRESMSGQFSENNKDETSADNNWPINPDIKNIPPISDDADSADSKEADGKDRRCFTTSVFVLLPASLIFIFFLYILLLFYIIYCKARHCL